MSDSRRFSIVSNLSWTRWYLDSDLSRTWSSDSPNVQVGLDRVQQYMLFFLFQNKDSLVPQMGNVIAIGLTPSRTGIVIGPSRTGFVIGRGGKSTKIFYSSKSTITLLKFYLSTSKSTSLKIYSSKSKK